MLDALAPGHPGARPRGVPDRVHHLRRDGLPGGDRLGRDVRPRPGRADGRRDRAGHGRGRRAPGAVAGARRRARLPLGPGRGDHRRGPVPRRDARRRLRPRPAERRRHRHPQALRRLLGLPRRPQPRPGVDGPARADGRHPAAVRDGRRPRRGRLGDELLLRRRRRAGRRGPLAAHRPAARRVGLRPAPSSPTTGRCRSSPRCTGSPRTPTTPARWRSPPASTSSCRTPSASAPGWSSGCAAASCPRTLVDRAARRLLTQKVELGLLDPDWTPEGSVAGDADRRPGLAPPTGRWPARWPSGPSCCSTPGPALPLLGDGRPALRRVAVVGPCAADPRTFMGCYAFPNHVLPRYPGPRARHRGADRASTRCAPSCRTSRSSTSRAARCRATTGPASPPRSPRPGRPTCAWPSSATSPGCSATALRRGLRRRGPPAARACRRTCSTSCWRPARRWSWSSSPAARTRSATCTAGPPAWSRRSCRARRAAPAIAGCPLRPGPARRQAAGADPAARRAGSRAPTCSRRSASRTPASATSTRRRCSRSATARSYTTFEVDDLRISDTEVPTDGEFTVSVRVRNTGSAGRRRGRPALPARRGRPGGPAGQAAGRLRPGHARSRARRADVPFRVHADRTAFTGRDLQRIVEPGDIEVLRRHLGGRPALPRHGAADRRRCASSGTTAGSSPRWTSARPASASARREDVVPSRDGRRRWPPSRPRPACPSRPSPRCSTAAPTSGPTTRALVESLLQQHDYVGRRPQRRGATRPRQPIELMFARPTSTPTPPRSCRACWTPAPRSASPSPSASARAARDRADGDRPGRVGPRPGRRRPPGGDRRGRTT